MPEIDVQDVDISTGFSSIKLDYPFFINTMTGGSDWTKNINEKLALLSRETGIAIASGSLSAALLDANVTDSFRIIRDINPTGLVFANIGAGKSVDDAKKAIDILQADALQIHLNAPQELIMIDGDRHFSNWLLNIEKIAEQITIPVIVKEVGFGMSQKTIKQLIDIGVNIIDISGRGGTNFAKIENTKRKKYDFLEDWGQSTIISLVEAQKFLSEVEFISSGGIKNPMDVIKSLALGAKAVGISGHFLHLILNDGLDNTIEEVNSWKEQLKTIMTLLNTNKIADLLYTDLYFTGEVKDWCLVRGLSLSNYANRSKK